MNVLFIYTQQNTVFFQKPLRGQEEIHFGISYIAAMLEELGHSCHLMVLNRKNNKKNYQLIEQTLQQFSPQLICFTSVFTESAFISNLASYIKLHYPDIFLILGGVHITLNPSEKVLEIFDALCIGEGEYPLTELVSQLSVGEQPSSIKNLWIKWEGNIEKNPTRPYIKNLDVLPFPNRAMWQPWILNPDTRITVLLGRGCPYNCTYCSNHRLRKVSEGEYVRLRSPENIVKEIRDLKNKHPKCREIALEVETLGVDLSWLTDLCIQLNLLNQSISEPICFSSNLRIYPRMDVDLIFSRLKLANFDSIIIGLESGSESLRKKILKRYYSNDDILIAVNTARKYGLKVGLFNLIGIPEETIEDYYETLRVNQQLQPDWHATSIFFPYQGTDLYDKVIALDALPKQLNSEDERQVARINYPNFSQKQIQKAFDNFHLDVYKKAPQKSILKLIVYYLQGMIGHNRLAKIKIFIIKTLYLLRFERIAVKFGLFGTFQKKN